MHEVVGPLASEFLVAVTEQVKCLMKVAAELGADAVDGLDFAPLKDQTVNRFPAMPVVFDGRLRRCADGAQSPDFGENFSIGCHAQNCQPLWAGFLMKDAQCLAELCPQVAEFST